MGKKDPHVDDYIANAEPFARPILRDHLGSAIVDSCWQGLREPEIEDLHRPLPEFPGRRPAQCSDG